MRENKQVCEFRITLINETRFLRKMTKGLKGEVIFPRKSLQRASGATTLLQQYVVQYFKDSNDGEPEDGYAEHNPTHVFFAANDDKARETAEAYIALNTYPHYNWRIAYLGRLTFSTQEVSPGTTYENISRAVGREIKDLDEIVSGAHFTPLKDAIISPQRETDGGSQYSAPRSLTGK